MKAFVYVTISRATKTGCDKMHGIAFLSQTEQKDLKKSNGQWVRAAVLRVQRLLAQVRGS
jgi:hypothetical protein